MPQELEGMGKPHVAKAMRGKLVVFEGSDGSGKATQATLLAKFFSANKIPSILVSFPRYESVWGQMIQRYLAGEFGNVDEVDPYLASMLYAADRLNFREKLEDWLASGKLVVCDRYVGSNIAHMGAKLPHSAEASRGRQNSINKFIEWLENLEYGENKIPREDLVIFLSVPTFVSQKLMRARKLDIHEKDIKYLNKVSGIFESLAKSKKNWQKIECTEGRKLIAPLEIHQKVLKVLRKRGVVSD